LNLESGSLRKDIAQVGKSEQIGGAALFLVSPLSDYVMGHVLVVDGGLSNITIKADEGSMQYA
jgi:enoyl-[acyl-carrier-protein] reductase (NADH)